MRFSSAAHALHGDRQAQDGRQAQHARRPRIQPGHGRNGGWRHGQQQQQHEQADWHGHGRRCGNVVLQCLGDQWFVLFACVLWFSKLRHMHCMGTGGVCCALESGLAFAAAAGGGVADVQQLGCAARIGW
jgi:hypothetical protein